MGDYKTLLAYQKAFDLAMKVHNTTKSFPKEERYSLTSQVLDSSRSVCANIVEAYKRRRYKNYYISRLNDAQTENAETQVWFDFSFACKYFSKEQYDELTKDNDEVARLIFYMINNPDKFC